MTDAELKALAEKVGLAIAQGAVLYLPALKAMGLEELVALVKAIDQKDRDAAYQLLAAKMTVAELAAEKAQLAALAELRAVKRAEALELADKILVGILKAALTALTTAAFL